MDELDSFPALWEWLTRDVTVVGGLQSPMLSWIGAAGILVLCLWHSTTDAFAVPVLRRTARPGAATGVQGLACHSRLWRKSGRVLIDRRKRGAILVIYKHWIVWYGRNRLSPENGFHTARPSQ